ncbi:hypothetical protein [Geobacter sp. SVR]|uniref:hypothetical protein n=1 Tax=Geobacter sp. SVR TaxID=2495594 RepID=UPI00143F01F8|nr:hypothetical protein [Geobacter sp. SVR]BCS55050.1 hypothetical protein GSVR_33580 [Geobacter sp. SVR]GCF85232.1 hypothetical protein GSbR_18320 [Geobacter sp. SVR]
MKVTEKSLKLRCTELNLGVLKDTTFGIRFDRTSKGYMVELQYRDGTPSKVLIQEASASEAAAAVEGAALGAAAVKDAGTGKPEFVTRETFVRQGGERCPKCQSKDINLGHLVTGKGSITQLCSCVRCSLVWNSIFRLDDYDCGAAVQ